MNIPEEFCGITEAMLKPYGYMPEGLPRLLPPFGEFEHFKVADQFTYISRSGVVVQSKANTLTDLATVPFPFRSMLDIPGRESVGAVVHDEGYSHPLRPRYNLLTKGYVLLGKSGWDAILNDIMIMARTPYVKRKCVNFGLDIGGWYCWNKAKKKNPCMFPMAVLSINWR